MVEKKNKNGNETVFLFIIVATALFFLSSNVLYVGAVVGTPNATVTTSLNVGSVFPEILNVSIDGDAATADLVANSTQVISCAAVIRDFNADTDISYVNATFYDLSVSNESASADNNYHYINTTCVINTTFGSYNGYNDTAYTALSNCSFEVQYYANPSEWTCNVTVNDSVDLKDNSFDNINISQLLALGLPDTIDYGTVNATSISNENQTNISNYGNVKINISLEGYAHSVGDGNAMNCTLGSLQNISIEHEKYNLTASNASDLSLGQADTIYTNLTTTPVVRSINLTQRQNDALDDTIRTSYWRMYVPLGVAGNCSGNIIFGATTAAGT